jgi:spore maturation protein CgeB
MYRVLSRSNVTINRHISIAENYANNMRLYEATGMGALLITDRKDNLDQIFEVDKEVLAYSSMDQARDLTLWAIENPSKAKNVAKAGQLRTLSSHTYSATIAQLNDELRKLTRIH